MFSFKVDSSHLVLNMHRCLTCGVAGGGGWRGKSIPHSASSLSSRIVLLFPIPCFLHSQISQKSCHRPLLFILASSPTTKLKQFRINSEVASILPTPWAFYMTHHTWSSLIGYLFISLKFCVFMSFTVQLSAIHERLKLPVHIWHLSFRLRSPSALFDIAILFECSEIP